MIVFTSDETTVNALTRSRQKIECWGWVESLHFGPIGDTHDLDDFAASRAHFFGGLGWDDSGEVEADFRLRNTVFRNALERSEKIVMLFGQGVGDQLPLARILRWLVSEGIGFPNENLLFAGDELRLAECSETQISNLLEQAAPVSQRRADEYSEIWNAFVDSEPSRLAQMCSQLETGSLRSAISRLLREYPSADNGLGLTECQILDAVSLGVSTPLALLERCRKVERNPFLNDWEFWAVIDRLTQGKSALLRVANGGSFLCPPRSLAWKEFQGQILELSGLGRKVLSGDIHRRELDFPSWWIGGVALTKSNLWYWDYCSEGITQEPRLPTKL